jgi:hypothetical protein
MLLVTLFSQLTLLGQQATPLMDHFFTRLQRLFLRKDWHFRNLASCRRMVKCLAWEVGYLSASARALALLACQHRELVYPRQDYEDLQLALLLTGHPEPLFPPALVTQKLQNHQL